MIERVAGCLEHGGRGLLLAPKKPFRTRRYLHSAFWSHGAGDIDLPAWWKFLLQAQETKNAVQSSRKRRSATEDVAIGLHEIFLNFLYPTQAHALVLRLDRATRIHRQAAHLAQQGTRKYTSIAENLLAGKTGTQGGVQKSERGSHCDTASTEKAQISHVKAEELLERLVQPEDYDELWKVQQDAFEASQPLEAGILKRIFYSLSASQRHIDLERSLALFETFTAKTPISYRRAVKAALGLNDVDTAVDIHLEAVANHPGSIDIGTPDILKYTIQHGQWRLAIDTWYRLWQAKLLYFSMQRDLWKEVDTLGPQDLMIKTEAAADFALSMTESTDPVGEGGPSRNAATAARDFALIMAERAFEVRGFSFNQIQYLRLVEKVKSLSNSSLRYGVLVLGQLLSLNYQSFLAAALDIYGELRQDPSFAPSQGLLEQMLTGLETLKSPSGMLMMLEDWQRYLPTKLPTNHYVTIARVLADSGHADGMEDLLRDFLNDYQVNDVPESIRTRVLNYTLWVHYKRADTRALLRKFDELQSQHSFIPNTLSYNTIIMTFARVGNVEKAMSWFKTLKDSGLALSHRTFSSLMSMYAKRGDVDAVQDLLEELEHNSMKPDMSIVDALVVVNVKDERYAEAERLVEEALHMDLDGPRTRMWNILLNAHALRADLKKVSAFHQRMHRAGVPEDSWTYAALLSSLCVSGNAPSAWGVMRDVMPQVGIKRTVLHYAILMGGYLRIKDYKTVFFCYKDMLKKKLVPDMNIHNTLIRAAARSDKKENKERNAEPTEFKRAREVLDVILQNLDPAELAAAGPRKFLGATPIDEAFTSTYYEYMTFLYGMEASFTKVTELYDEYIATAKKYGKEDVENNPPMMMLSALLTAHRRAGNDEEVDRCWYLALDKIEKLSKRSNANLAEPGWVLPARRFLINVPLRQYMKHLNDRGRIDDMINVIKDLRWAGYELHSPKWNDYVAYLASSLESRHRYLAFETCERELMQNWPGWSRLASSGIDKTGGSWWHMKRAMKRENRGGALLTFKRMAQYKTLVQLAGVYMEARSGYNVPSGDVSRDQLAKLAPITVDAVRQLPWIPDEEQTTYLPAR